MKKSFFSLISAFVLCFMMVFAVSSCTSCNPTTEDSASSLESEATALDVENIISMDRQQMYLQYSNDYRWFETCIVLEDFLDEECDGTVTGVSNVFQVVTDGAENSADVHVVLMSHSGDLSQVDVKHGFWIGDNLLNDEYIKVTFKEAFENLMRANIVKPHSRQVVLRKQLGPVNANPQYIFGNTHAQVYVDATTGAVSAINPVFPEGAKLAMPLGEWP